MRLLAILACAACAAVLLAPDTAAAHGRGHWHGHGHVHGGVFIGIPFAAPYYRPPVYYGDYPPLLAVPTAPPVYVERADEPAQTADGWWYYCRSAQAYYPSVATCPQGWEKVAPQAPR